MCGKCRAWTAAYASAYRKGGQIVRCPCGKEFRDYTGRRFCSLACQAPPELFRVCRDCGEPKPLTTEFFRPAPSKTGDRIWLARTCNDCFHAVVKRNRDDAMARDPDAVRAYGRQKYAKRPALYKGFVRRRKAQKRTSRTERVDLEAILAEHGLVCHICTLEIPSADAMDFDHVIPLARGGTHTAGNILPAHSTCNRWKGARLLGELDLTRRREHMARKLGLPVAA